MSEKNTYKFNAFISYSRNDEETAKKIERMLERYVIPKPFVSGRRNFRIFRDAKDLGLGELSGELQNNLDQSEFLIVICSPYARLSSYVSKEIEYFGDKRGSKFIIPVLARGRPNNEVDQIDAEQDQSFNDSLYKYFQEPLAADFRIFEHLSRSEQKKRLEEAKFQIIAKLLKTDKSEKLVGRERKRIRKRNTMITGFLAIVIAGVLLFPYEIWQELNFKLQDPSNEVIESCEVIDEKVNIFSKWTDLGPRGKRLYIRQYEEGADSLDREGYLEDHYTPTNRLFPRRAMNREVVSEAMDRFGALLNEVVMRSRGRNQKVDWWIGKPKPDSYIVIVANHASYVPSIMSDNSVDPQDAINPPEDDEYYAESMIMTYHDGKIDTAVISGFYPVYEHHGIHLHSPAKFIPSFGLPFSWEGSEIWVAAPMRSNGEKGMLLHSEDNGANWKEVEGFPNVFSIAGSKEGEIYLTQKGFEHTNAAGVNTKIESEIFRFNIETRTWQPADGPPYGPDSEVECCGLTNNKPVFRVDEKIYNLERMNIMRDILFRSK